MTPLFKQAAYQASFETDGFVQIPLLNEEQVNALVSAYAPFRTAHESINLPYITTSHSNNPNLITAVDETLQAIIAPALTEHLFNYKLLFGNYLVKMPVLNSETDPHQDITFVDETQYVSANIWIALEDITPANGGMYFLKGSHKFMPTIRPTHHYPWPYENVKPEIIKNAVSFSAKAGDAFIFNHAVIHGSYANTTQKYRLAAVVAAYSEAAPLVHYYLPDITTGRLEKYSMNKEAYLYFEKEKPPMKGVFEEAIHFNFNRLTANEFSVFTKPPHLSLIQRLQKQFFS